MPTFLAKLESALTEDSGIESEYLDPDTWWYRPGAVCFFYATTGKMYYGVSEQSTHKDIFRNYFDELAATYDQEILETLIGPPEDESIYGSEPIYDPDRYEESNTGDRWRALAEELGLLGRVGYFREKDWIRGPKVASVWTKDRSLLRDHLADCVSRLIGDGALGPTDYVSYPFKTVPVSEVASVEPAELSPEESERLALLHRLHLMGPGEKKATMAKLGLAGGRKSDWQQRAEKHELVVPGQRYWAMQSESS